MREERTTPDRLAAYSDAVFAVIVTVMVLELKAPDQPEFSALWPLWPTAISYAMSYLFIAIIWINHHHLMRLAGPPTLRLMWTNFVHLFMVSLLPFATAWIARTRLASSPVVFYAGLFVCIDLAYNVFEREVLTRAAHIPDLARRLARRRSLVVLATFLTAMFIAFVAPRIGFGLICGALILHLRPGTRHSPRNASEADDPAKGVRPGPMSIPHALVRRIQEGGHAGRPSPKETAMSYIDGFVIAVPNAKREQFIGHASTFDAIFMEFGATRVMECWGDDVPDGKLTDFRRAVQAKDGESVVFSWIEWPDKATRDAGMEKFMKDPRMAAATDMPFDGKRMIFGGFAPVVSLPA